MKSRNFIFILGVFFLLHSTLPAFAQRTLSKSFDIRTEGIRPKFTKLFRDSKGLIWTGTDKGIFSFDGINFSKITGREFIQLLCSARGKQAIATDQRNIFDLPLDQYASTYSTGMKKKLALTAILMQTNECFVLDEPFNGVDIHSNIIITDIIRKLKELNKTIIISSHIFATLNDTCDEIHLLKEGVFIKKVCREEFGILEQEMKDFTIGNKIDKLMLT